MDRIEISNLRLRTHIGFSAHELDARQDVVVSLRIGLADRRAGESDDPADALNYRTIAKAIIQFVEASRFALLEKLAEEIARLTVVDFGAPWIEVRVTKPGALRRSDAAGVRIRRRSADYARNIAYISLGSNIMPEANVATAMRLLRKHTTLLARSSVYESPPQGYAEQAPFLNLAVKVRTLRTPLDFKTEVIDAIEARLKRRRDPRNKNAPRTIDLDISLWNNEILEYGDKPWKIPDADIRRFAHVALPLAELAPDYRHPESSQSLRDIAASLDASALRRVELALAEPGR